MSKSKWFGYDLLLFLVDVETARPGYSSEVEPEDIEVRQYNYSRINMHRCNTVKYKQ